MTKTFASLTAAMIVTLATSLAAAQASAVVLAPEVRVAAHLHVVTPHVVAPRVVTPRIAPLRGPVVRPVVRPRAGVPVVAPLRGPVVHPRARGRAIIRR